MNVFRKHREILGNRYAIIRDAVQHKRPFVILNFVTEDQYNRFMLDLNNYGRLPYILQEICSQGSKFPSIFLTNYESSVSIPEFKELVKQTMKNYKLDSIVGLYNGGVSVVYKNGQHSPIGSEMYSSIDPNVFNSDHYKIEGKYYTFI